jgi:hypothetical protein
MASDIEGEEPGVRELSVEQRAAVELLVAGRTDDAVARRIRVHRVTVTRWRLYHLRFAAELNRRRQEVWGSAGDRVRGLLGKALRVFRDQLTHPDAGVQFRAARTLLEFAGSGKFAPGDDPVDAIGLLDRMARQSRRERLAADDADAPLEDQDREQAIERLLERCAGKPVSLPEYVREGEEDAHEEGGGAGTRQRAEQS